jgi:NAD/NADP transhydrogenase beta subunit
VSRRHASAGINAKSRPTAPVDVYRDNTMMLLGDAKKMTESIVKSM